MPVLCNAPCVTRAAALSFPTGVIKLAFCPSCGLIFNQAYECKGITYDAQYENSLHYSSRFDEYIRSLAKDLVERFDLYEKDVIEIGCGKGEFLALLCELGDNRGMGFDPSVEDKRLNGTATQRVRLIRDFYNDAYSNLACDFLCCRQTLEHISQPAAFLCTVRNALGVSNKQTAVFFEVPNALYTLRHKGIWDIIYEHVTYFWSAPLSRLFAQCGFDVKSVRESYGGQFLCLEAFPGLRKDICGLVCRDEMEQVIEEVQLFGETFRTAVEVAARVLDRAEEQKQRVIVWGAGSKGVTFLNVFKDRSILEYAVDVNPHKQGKFVPGTGQPIMPPQFLSEYEPDVVLVMNPLYQEEIARYLDDLSIVPKLVLV
jgi:SAM-dependent methyltransferase